MNDNQFKSVVLIIVLLGVGTLSLYSMNISANIGSKIRDTTVNTTGKDDTVAATSPLCDSFPRDLSLEEADRVDTSADPCWWLDSGAVFFIQDGIGQTQMGTLPETSRWVKLYAESDAIDTKFGQYPQNIFRLINKMPAQDFREAVYFNIDSYNAINSPNRNESNGVFLFGRYRNSNDLYYGGIRVDGTVVIKRKLNGIYETLASAIYDNSSSYDSTSNPNLLPTGQWIGIALEMKNTSGTKIMIQLDADMGDGWQTVLTTIDDPTKLPDGGLLTFPGNTGIRTDFMDVLFKDYSIAPLS